MREVTTIKEIPGSATNPPCYLSPLLVLSEVHSPWVRNSGSWWWATVAASRGHNLGHSSGRSGHTNLVLVFFLFGKFNMRVTTIDWDDRHLSSVRGTKELIAEGPCTHRLTEFTSDLILIQQNEPVDIIESTSLETKI